MAQPTRITSTLLFEIEIALTTNGSYQIQSQIASWFFNFFCGYVHADPLHTYSVRVITSPIATYICLACLCTCKALFNMLSLHGCQITWRCPTNLICLSQPWRVPELHNRYQIWFLNSFWIYSYILLLIHLLFKHACFVQIS